MIGAGVLHPGVRILVVGWLLAIVVLGHDACRKAQAS